MRIILLKDVKNLGKTDDVKEVACGYARNFLFPRGLAVNASEKKLLELRRKLEAKTKIAEAEAKIAKELVKKLAGFKLEISSKIGKTGKLFGSITPLKITKLLLKEGFEVKKEQIILKGPIKELGKYDIIIDLGHELKEKVRVIVKEEK